MIYIYLLILYIKFEKNITNMINKIRKNILNFIPFIISCVIILNLKNNFCHVYDNDISSNFYLRHDCYM